MPIGPEAKIYSPTRCQVAARDGETAAVKSNLKLRTFRFLITRPLVGGEAQLGRQKARFEDESHELKLSRGVQDALKELEMRVKALQGLVPLVAMQDDGSLERAEEQLTLMVKTLEAKIPG